MKHQLIQLIEDITCPRVDTNFIFERSTRYLTSEGSERVSYRVEHEISEHFRKFSEVSKVHAIIFYHFPKISEDVRRFPKITEGGRIFPSNLRRCFDYI